MITRRMRIRRHLRSVRASALTEEERRQELREAESRLQRDQGCDETNEPAVSPRAAGEDGASALREADPERAGVVKTD
jgi:hypothetical protein